MKLSARFTEYGLVGAFFLIALFFIVLTSKPLTFQAQNGLIAGVAQHVQQAHENFQAFRAMTAPKNAASSPGKDPPSEEQFSQALAAALGVVAVFVTGLLLDLLSFIFIYAEMWVFHAIVRTYASDFQKIMELFPTRVKKDYDRFLQDFGDGFIGWPRNSRGLPWKLLNWVKVVVGRLGLLIFFARTFSFFVAYAVSGEMKLDALADHLRVWRTVRGISVSAILLASVWFAIHVEASARVLIPVLISVFVISMFVVGFNFSRLCASLLASVWVVARKDEELLAASIAAKQARPNTFASVVE